MAGSRPLPQSDPPTTAALRVVEGRTLPMTVPAAAHLTGGTSVFEWLATNNSVARDITPKRIGGGSIARTMCAAVQTLRHRLVGVGLLS
jgi:hypothetical protein